MESLRIYFKKYFMIKRSNYILISGKLIPIYRTRFNLYFIITVIKVVFISILVLIVIKINVVDNLFYCRVSFVKPEHWPVLTTPAMEDTATTPATTRHSACVPQVRGGQICTAACWPVMKCTRLWKNVNASFCGSKLIAWLTFSFLSIFISLSSTKRQMAKEMAKTMF